RSFKKDLVKKLTKPEELAIIQRLADLPELLELIAEYREPHRLATYLEELSAIIHRYYARYQIVSAKSKELSLARLMLLDTTKTVMGIVFDLMGISAPEKM
ncbi:MAG: DALR anticodon-binding domain-containing protein, partial [Candidatus Cloacimonadaceae bacterium]